MLETDSFHQSSLSRKKAERKSDDIKPKTRRTLSWPLTDDDDNDVPSSLLPKNLERYCHWHRGYETCQKGNPKNLFRKKDNKKEGLFLGVKSGEG